MNIDFTTTALLNAVKFDAMIPASQLLYQDADILSILTRELLSDIVPLLMSVREEYLVSLYDQAIVATQSIYAISPRAFGTKLRDVVLVNAQGLELPLPRADMDVNKHQYTGIFPPYVYRRSFYFRDDKVVIFPDASVLSPFTLRMKIFRRPNMLVATTAAGQITGFNATSKTVNIGNLPSSWTTSSQFDFINGNPPFNSRGDDAAIMAIDSTNKILTFSAALPTDLAIGDWVALSGQSPIAQIPFEVHNLLSQRGVIKILEGLKDAQGLQMAADVYKDMVDKFKLIVTPRADGSPKRIVRGSVLFGGGRRRSAWW